MGRPFRSLLLATTALLAPAAGLAQAPDARPQGGQVVAGQASISQSATRTQVNQATNRAVIEWRGFDIGASHQVDIRQPGAGSWSLQRVTGGDPSSIAGQLTSNGGVALVNPAGIVFQNGAQVDVAGLIATTADTTNEAFMAGRMAFDGASRPGARVENRGTVTVREQGLAALVGPVAANSGTIRARLGRVAIAGAEAFTLDLAGDGLLSFDVTRQVAAAPSGATALATNSGTIQAEGGHVLLTARAASGILENLVEAGGSIAAAGGTVTANAPGGGVLVPAGAVLDASGGGRVTVGAAANSEIGAPQALSSRTTVRRGASLNAEGGSIIVHAAQRTEMRGSATARGGRIEVSSRGALALDATLDAGPTGSILVDPEEARIVDSLSGATEPYEVTAATVNSGTGTFTLQANRAIRVLAAVDRQGGGLTLETLNAAALPGDGIFIEAPVNVVGDLVLRSAGDITQLASGAWLSASTLRAESGVGRVRLEAGDNVIYALDGGSAATRYDVATSTDLSVDGAVSAPAMRLTARGRLRLHAPLIAGSVMELVGLDGIAQDASGAPVTAGMLFLESAFAGIALNGSGNRISALGDVSAPAGLALRSDGAMVVAGVLNALGAGASLTVESGDLTQDPDASRVLADSLVARAPGGSVLLDRPYNYVQHIAGSARDDFTLDAGAPLTVAGRIEAARISLASAGDLTQEAGALHVTPLLRARASYGSVLLDDPLNEVSGLGASGADGAFSLATLPSLTITGRVAAPQVSLVSGGGVLGGTGAAIEAYSLRVIGLTGEVALDQPGHRVAELSGSAAGGFAFANDGALDVAGPLDAGGALSLRAQSLLLGANLDAPSVTLRATDGAILQEYGRIATAALRAEATAGVRIEAAGNAIAAVSGSGGSAFRIRTATALTADDIAAEEVALAAGLGIAQPEAGLGISAGLLSAEAGGRVDLAAATNAIRTLGGIVAPGGFALRTTTALDLTAPLDLPAVSLIAGGGITQRPGATLGAATLALSSGGDILLEEAGNATPRLLAASAAGELRLATSGALSLEGNVTAGELVSLTAFDSIAQAGGVVTAPVLLARSVLGGVTLDAANLVDAAGGGAAGTWRLRQGRAGALRLAGLIAAPEVALILPAALIEAGGSLRTDVLTLEAGGAVVLEGAGHRVGAISGGHAGSLRLAVGGPIEVTGALDIAGGLDLSADAISFRAPVSAGGPGLLVARSGDIAQAASGAGLSLGGPVRAYAAGSVALAGEGNAIPALAGGSAEGGFALATGGALSVTGALSGETLLLRAGGQVTLDGAALRAGRAVLVAARAGIAAGAQTSLEPLDPARLPVLILDTRMGGLAAMPDTVQADLPGLPAAAASRPRARR